MRRSNDSIPIPGPTCVGILKKRYKRFLADVELEDGRIVVAHCPNSGSMKTCAEPGRPVVLSESDNPKRKLRYTWELIRMGRTWVGVHSSFSNRLLEHLIPKQQIPELAGYASCKREVKYGSDSRSRIDLLLEAPDRPPCYVEIKHSTMRVGTFAAFPDAVTTRGRKHLEDLAHVAQRGCRAAMLFVVGRNDCQRFRPAEEIDPDYAQALRDAVQAGVEVLVYRFQYSPNRIRLTKSLPYDLADVST